MRARARARACLCVGGWVGGWGWGWGWGGLVACRGRCYTRCTLTRSPSRTARTSKTHARAPARRGLWTQGETASFTRERQREREREREREKAVPDTRRHGNGSLSARPSARPPARPQEHTQTLHCVLRILPPRAHTNTRTTHTARTHARTHAPPPSRPRTLIDRHTQGRPLTHTQGRHTPKN